MLDARKLRKGDQVRAVTELLVGDTYDVAASPGDVGEVVVAPTREGPWPTVLFPHGSTVVFDDEVEKYER
jgi:hypothetical protein